MEWKLPVQADGDCKPIRSLSSVDQLTRTSDWVIQWLIGLRERIGESCAIKNDLEQEIFYLSSKGLDVQVKREGAKVYSLIPKRTLLYSGIRSGMIGYFIIV